ncbi:MAG: beta galactosidase jelly roll domain-containing protein, partial [Mogibacterium sp.]|nr:beta galactosidase jelly roll domain-containing protein [Mogibacterium sp.]
MQKSYPFNDWYYKDSFLPEDIQTTSLEGFASVTLPHTNREIPYNYFDETSTMFVSCYRKVFNVPEEWTGKRVFLHFEAVANVADVYLNGFHLGQHKGGYTSFTFELTDDLIISGNNVLTVKVDSTERDDVPPFGYLIDYLCYGGIYREAQLIVCDSVYVTAMHITPENVLSAEKSIAIKLWTDSTEELPEAPLTVTVTKEGETIKTVSFLADIPEGKGTIHISLDGLVGINLWDIDDPQMYTVKIELDDITLEDRCGFREAKFTVNGFYLNGEKIKLMGLNRHQSYPYVGNAMP